MLVDDARVFGLPMAMSEAALVKMTKAQSTVAAEKPAAAVVVTVAALGARLTLAARASSGAAVRSTVAPCAAEEVQGLPQLAE